MYKEDNIKILGTDMPWVTRAPATLDDIERLLDAELDFTPGTDLRYSFHISDLNYGGVPQRAVVVWSEKKQKRYEQTFERKIQKETIQAEKDIKKLMGRKFACVHDAEREVTIWTSVHPHHLIKNLSVLLVAEKIEKRRGRPKKDEPVKVSFKIEAQIDLNNEALNDERKKLGRFVLVSNDIDLDPETMLGYYKGQQTVERGFRFLKDKCFHVLEVYLKKEEWIEALCMIMVLSLLVYSFAELRLRERLKSAQSTTTA